MSRATLRARVGVIGALAVCSYLLFFRVHEIDDSFAMLGEQIRDWSIAQRPFGELPLAGPRSLNSGADIGPAYYWFLWLGRTLLAPFLGNFPHTGGWATSLLQSVSDFVLLIALWRRLQLWVLATAIVLLYGTSPLDAGLSASVWNPPVAVACVKLATAALLWHPRPSTLTSVAVIIFAWLAVQMHLSAAVVAAPFTLWIAYTAGSTATLHRIAACGLALCVSIGLVAAPYIASPIDRGRVDGVGASLETVAADPFAQIRLADSAAGVGAALDRLLTTPQETGLFAWLIAIGVVLILGRERLSVLSIASACVLLTAVALFSLWQGSFSETYWFAVAAPAGAICAFGPLAFVRGRYRMWAGALLVLILLGLQPSRAEVAWTRFRLPAYGPLWRGAVAIASTGQRVSAVEADFEVPPGMDALFLLRLAKGQFDPESSLVAVTGADGTVRFRRKDEKH